MSGGTKRAAPSRLGGTPKRSSRPGNPYNLRWLMFAPGDQHSIGKRSPLFDEVFYSMLNSFTFENDQWLEEDAVALMTLAMMTTFFLRNVLFDGVAKAAEKAGGDDADDDGVASDDGADETLALPTVLLPKLVSIIISLLQLFNFADGLINEIDWIRPVCRSYRSAFGCLLGKSRAYSQTQCTVRMQSFVNAKLAPDVWVCDGNAITNETMEAFFNESPAVLDMIASQDAKRSVLARTVSINAHARETNEEIKEIKTVLFTLAKMVSFHCSVHRIHCIDLSCPPPPTRRWRSSTRNSTRSCPPTPTRKVRPHHSSQ